MKNEDLEEKLQSTEQAILHPGKREERGQQHKKEILLKSLNLSKASAKSLLFQLAFRSSHEDKRLWEVFHLLHRQEERVPPCQRKGHYVSCSQRFALSCTFSLPMALLPSLCRVDIFRNQTFLWYLLFCRKYLSHESLYLTPSLFTVFRLAQKEKSHHSKSQTMEIQNGVH